MKDSALPAARQFIIHSDWYAISKALALLWLAQAVQFHYPNIPSKYGT
jgi:hypothetical protein